MKQLKKGEYFGSHYAKLETNNFVITDTEYTHDYVDWHYHENPYFTFLLQGLVREQNKAEEYNLEAGSLAYHNWQDKHRNIKSNKFTRGFHIELNDNWFSEHSINNQTLQGTTILNNPRVKNIVSELVVTLHRDSKNKKKYINFLLIELFANLNDSITIENHAKPLWVEQLKALLQDDRELKSAKEISQQLNIHPVYFSKSFRKYFGCSFMEYHRSIQLNKAFSAILQKNSNLTEVAYQSGFYDQSHFIAAFKKQYNCTPKQFQKLVG